MLHLLKVKVIANFAIFQQCQSVTMSHKKFSGSAKNNDTYILKVKKSADSTFQSKKSAEKMRKLRRQQKCVYQSKV